MYIAKSEAQAYVDSAALSAVRYLDGTSSGIAAAQSAVSADQGNWRFDSSTFTNVTTTYGTTQNGPWISAPPNPPTGYNYVQVATSVNLPMYLIRVLSGPTATVNALAIAGRSPLTTIRHGVFPFSPITRSGTYTDSNGNSYSPTPDDPNDPFGFKIGNDYTILWGAPGNKTNCGTDDFSKTQPLANNGNERGYCCVATTAATLRDAIVGGDTDTETIGNNVAMDNGQKNSLPTDIAWRVDEDSDPNSNNYQDYISANKGNGARVVVVPVNSGAATNFQLVGFAAFYLKNDKYYQKLNGNDSACATYIGAWTGGVIPSTPSGSGAYVLRLFQ
jgi:hypothetical protein